MGPEAGGTDEVAGPAVDELVDVLSVVLALLDVTGAAVEVVDVRNVVLGLELEADPGVHWPS